VPEDVGAASGCARGWDLLQPAQAMVITNAAVATRRVSVIMRQFSEGVGPLAAER
jgi:hypothetical protein